MRLFAQAMAAALAAFPPFNAGTTAAAAAQMPPFATEEGFRAYLPQLRAQAEREGVSRRTLDQIFPTLQFSPRTVELDRAQPGGTAGNPAIPPFAPYLRTHLTPALISRGQQRYSENVSRLNEISRRYGVDPSVLIAIWGKETSYGTVMGDFDLMNSLASLAYEGRRRQLFTEEFIATLKMYERGYPRSQLKGSWAGATGHPQFLPSVYLRVAADGDGDGRADIWRNHVDALASIANYLSNAGWKPNVRWGYRVSVPAGFNRSGFSTRLLSPRCPRVHERHTRWMSIGEWRRLGVTPFGSAPDDELATLLEPDGAGQPAYLLTTNYRTILDYNCSNFYALAVGLLADSVSR
jgi:lytic murein transglycosylase